MSRKAPSNGDPSSVLIAAKLPALAMMAMAVGGESFLIARMASPPRSAAHRDQRRFGSEYRSERERGQRGQDNAGQLDRQRGSTGLEALGRRVTAITREIPDRQGDEEAAQRQQWHWPPNGNRRETELRGQAAEQILLQPVDQRQEPVGDGRHRNADRRRQYEGLHVAARTDDRERIDIRRRRRRLLRTRRHELHVLLW